MIYKKHLLFVLTLLLVSCNKSNIPNEFFEEPEYIKSSSSQIQEYFKAYNNSLSLLNVDYDEIYVPTSYGIAHIIVSGPVDAEPLVLLHGMNATSTSWYPNFKALSRNDRIYAIDLLVEPGKSIATKEVKSIDELSSWYYEVFKKLHLNKINLLGASRGGWLAVQVALQNKVEISNLVLLSPAQTFTWIKPSRGLIKNIFYSLYSSKEGILQSLETMTNDISKIDDTYLKQYYLGMQLNMENKFLSSMKPFSEEALSKLDMPVLVLIGDNDVINDVSSIENAKKSIKNFEGKVIQDSGHFVSVDQATIVNNKIIEFLNNDN